MTFSRRAANPLLLATALVIVPAHAWADTLVDNVAGVSPDGKGGVTRFDAFLIGNDGRIAHVYGHGDKLPKKVEYRLDGKGRVVVPGMIDAHAHVMRTGIAALTLDLSAARSLDEALSRIAAWSAAHPELPWILGSGWNQAAWGLDRMPTARELDTVTGGRPAWLLRVDGHAGWANSAALKAADVTAATTDPAGGRIIRLPGGKQPAGVLVDSATALVEAKAPRPRPEDLDTALGEAQLAFLANGVTAVADMGTTIEDWQAYRRAADAGRLRMRIVAYAKGIDNMALIGGPGPSPWLYADKLKLNGVELVLDGALGSRGAWLAQPYADAPDTRGLAQMNETQLGNLMSRAAIDNFQVAVRASGDAAVQTVLDSIDELSDTYKGDRRWRIEGADVLTPGDLSRLGKHTIVVSMQPQVGDSDSTMVQARLGADRYAHAQAFKAVQDSGATLAFGSGAPAQPPHPFAGMARATQALATPLGANPALTPDAALAAYTSGAAEAMFAGDRLGRIAPGYRADFLFVDHDPTAATAPQLQAMHVEETWIGGQLAWKAGKDKVVPAKPMAPDPMAASQQNGR